MDAIQARADTDRMHRIAGDGVVMEPPTPGAHTTTGFRVNHCMWAGRTGAGADVVLAESPVFGTMLFLDDQLQSTEYDERVYHEALIHPALNALADRPRKRVLVVGGGEGACARELLRYGPEAVARVVWVDIDPDLVALCRRYLAWADDGVYNDARLRYVAADAARVLRRGAGAGAGDDRLLDDERFDAIYLDLPDPEEEPAAGGYLYSAEFWADVAGALAPGGVVATHAGPVEPGDAAGHRPGLTRIQRDWTAAGLGAGHAYHTPIPSFQGEWGFAMTAAPAPVRAGAVPAGLQVYDDGWQAAAFAWPRFWTALGPL